MIIQCPNCSEKFIENDPKIPEVVNDMQVNCYHCHHNFVIVIQAAQQSAQRTADNDAEIEAQANAAYERAKARFTSRR